MKCPHRVNFRPHLSGIGSSCMKQFFWRTAMKCANCTKSHGSISLKCSLLEIERNFQYCTEKSYLQRDPLLHTDWVEDWKKWPFLVDLEMSFNFVSFFFFFKLTHTLIGVGLGKHDFPVQIWTFHSISSKNFFFLQLELQLLTSMGQRIGRITFLCRSGHFIKFQTENILLKINSHSPHGVGGWQTWLQCKSGHFMQFLAANVLANSPPSHELVSWKSYFRCGNFSLRFLVKNIFFWKLTTSPTLEEGVGKHDFPVKIRHFKQFLARKLFASYPPFPHPIGWRVGKDHSCVDLGITFNFWQKTPTPWELGLANITPQEIWALYGIAGKQVFWNNSNTLLPPVWRWRVGKDYIPCRSWHFIHFLANTHLEIGSRPTLYGEGDWQTWLCCTGLDISGNV